MGGKATNARILAATNQDLHALVRTGRLRQDLFFRLDVVRVEVPPLRTRKEDWPQLVAGLIQEICDRADRPVPVVEPSVFVEMASYGWPGNVRELRSVLERSILACQHSKITSLGLPASATQQSNQHVLSPDKPRQGRRAQEDWSALLTRPLADLVEEFRNHLRGALAATGGNVTQAAKLCRMNRSTFLRQVLRAGWKEDNESAGVVVGAETAHEIQGTKASPPRTEAAARPAVLLVDDDPLERRALTRLFKPLADRIAVHTAADGTEALAKTENICPALIVLDVIMPGLDGIAVCCRFRNNPSMRSTKILIMSANMTADVKQDALEAGADGAIEKPIRQKDVLDLVGL